MKEKLTKIEFLTVFMTALFVGGLAFPGPTTADYAGSVMVALFTLIALSVIVVWIKGGGSWHL